MNVLAPPNGYYRKKRIPIRAVPVTEEIVINTLEGTEIGRPGDMLLTGVQGEQYLMSGPGFRQFYEAVGADLYVKRPIAVYARRAERVERFDLPWGQLQAEPGDYILRGPDGGEYPIKREILIQTYEYLGPDQRGLN